MNISNHNICCYLDIFTPEMLQLGTKIFFCAVWSDIDINSKSPISILPTQKLG